MPANFFINGRGAPWPKPISELIIDYVRTKYTLADPPLVTEPAPGDSYTDTDMADKLIITKSEAGQSPKYSYHLGVVEQDADVSRATSRSNQWAFNEPLEFQITVKALRMEEDTSWLQFHNLSQEILGIIGQYKTDGAGDPPILGLRSIMIWKYQRPVVIGNLFKRTIFTMLSYQWQDDTPP